MDLLYHSTQNYHRNILREDLKETDLLKIITERSLACYIGLPSPSKNDP